MGAKGIEEIAQILQKSTALVLPSHSEPWGLVVNESLSYGCPVVVSSVCGCAPDLVIDGETGYSFSSGDVDGLARSMLDVVRLSEDRVNVARRCLKLMENFTPERAAAQILDGCIKLLEKET